MIIKFIFLCLEAAISSSNKRQMLIVKQKYAKGLFKGIFRWDYNWKLSNFLYALCWHTTELQDINTFAMLAEESLLQADQLIQSSVQWKDAGFECCRNVRIYASTNIGKW